MVPKGSNPDEEQQARFEQTIAIARETAQIIRDTGGPLDFSELYDEVGLPR